MFKGLFSNTRSKGEHYELIAEQFLVKQGLTPVTRNYLCKYGEIDSHYARVANLSVY